MNTHFACVLKLLSLTIIALCLISVPSLSIDGVKSDPNDPGNIMEQKKQQSLKEQYFGKKKAVKDIDPSLRIILSSHAVTYLSPQQPVIDVHLINASKETRWFKRIWSPVESDNIKFTVLLDGKESLNSGMIVRMPVAPDSTDPKDGIKLDPGQSALITRFKVLKMNEGEHLLKIQYQSFTKVTGPKPLNWWTGIAESNTMTVKVSRNTTKQQITEVGSSAILSIHAQLKILSRQYPAIAGYSDAALVKSSSNYLGIPSISYKTKTTGDFIRIYFQTPSYTSTTRTTYERVFPDIQSKIIAHLDISGDPRLRQSIIRKIQDAEVIVYKKLPSIASSIKWELQPVAPEIAKKIRRAPNVVLATIKTKKVEDITANSNQIRQWIITAKVTETFNGSIKRGTSITLKSGALPTFFGDSRIEGKKYILLLGENTSWRKEYPLLGAEMHSDQLITWLRNREK